MKKKFTSTAEFNDKLAGLFPPVKCKTLGCGNTSRGSVLKDGLCSDCRDPHIAAAMQAEREKEEEIQRRRESKFGASFGEWA